MVKKSTLKLTIRRETLRKLGGMDLARVVAGGPGAAAYDTVDPAGCAKANDSEGLGTGCPSPAKP